MLKILQYIFLTFYLFVIRVQCFDSAAPVWLTSQYFRAGNQYVISTRTGNDQTPEYTFTFSTALPGIPYLAYGIKNYRGDDYFGVEQFEVRREDLTDSTFRVAVQIFGSTYIWMMGVPYIAIDPLFPHRLNSFDGVPLNYGAGALVNVTSKNANQILYYTNTINFTQQAAGTGFTRFEEPIQNNKILLFMMALNIWSTNEGGSSTWYPLTLDVSYEIVSTQEYKLKFELSYKVQISLLHFSMIIFDQADVESSKKYFIVTEKVDFPIDGGFYEFPQEFTDNFIMGLLDFSTVRGQAVLQYNWEFETVDGVYGARVNYSIPTRASVLGDYALTRQGTMIFYMKTWLCPEGYDYFNLTTNLCQDMCGEYNFENNTVYECQFCSYSCLDCTSGQDCLLCNEEFDHRQIKADKSCSCMKGYFDDGENTSCVSCGTPISDCIDCFYNTSYQASDAGTGAFEYGCFECNDGFLLLNNQCEAPAVCPPGSLLNPITNQCLTCPEGQSLNMITYICQTCPTGCTSCSDAGCLVCDNSLNYFLQAGACELCDIIGCSTCASLTVCLLCRDSFTFNSDRCICTGHTYYEPAENSCMQCSDTCITCDGPSQFECLTCNETENRVLLGAGNCGCDPFNYIEPADASTSCIKINNLVCDRGYYFVSQTQRCEEICGDGIKLEVSCDDGNIKNGDGCSDKCEIEESFVCGIGADNSSVCKFEGEIQIEDTKVEKVEGSNQVNFRLKLEPQGSIFSQYDWKSILEFQDPSIQISEAYYDEETGQLILNAKYSSDISEESLQLQVKSQHQFNSEDNGGEDILTTTRATFSFSSQPISILTDNNLQLNYYDESAYEDAQQTNKAGLAFAVSTLVIAGIAFFLKNSISLIMNVTTIQLAFIGMVAIEGQHPITSALVKSTQPVLGFNMEEVNNSESETNTRANQIGFEEHFYNNFNVMFLIQMGFLIFSGFIYTASHRKSSIKLIFKIIQRETLLIIVFNLPNTIFALTLITEINLLNVLFGSVTALIVFVQAIHVTTFGTQYWNFKQIFNFSEKSHYKKVMAMFFISRVGSCLSLSLVDDTPKNGLLGAIILSLFFVVTVVAAKPFISFFSNLFVVACELIGVVFYVIIYTSESTQKNISENCIYAMVYIFGAMAVIAVVNLIYSIAHNMMDKGKMAKVYNNINEIKAKSKNNSLFV